MAGRLGICRPGGASDGIELGRRKWVLADERIPSVSNDELPPGRAPRAGWVPHQAEGRDVRWGDGAAWTGSTRPQRYPPWRDWVITSPWASRVNVAVMVLAGIGIVIAAVVVLLSLVQGRPQTGLIVLLVPAIPAVLFDHFWVIAVASTRIPGRRFGLRHIYAGIVSRSRSMWRLMFGPLPDQAAYILKGLLFLGWVAAITAVFTLKNGGTPNGGTPECPYQLIDVGLNGISNCVSLTAYQHAGAVEQRLVASALLSFFVFQFTIACSEFLQRREAAARR
jgi:hypothetical protein